MQNDSFGRGLYAAQTGDPGVSEGASQTFPVIHTMRAAQAAVVELIERWAGGSANRLRWAGRRRRALARRGNVGAGKAEVKSREVYVNRRIKGAPAPVVRFREGRIRIVKGRRMRPGPRSQSPQP